jgi:hypothetical protein
MSNETKALREDLTRAIDILMQTPVSLNIYVEQVNTLKYIRERMPDFKNKFSSIEKLSQLCKKHKIAIKKDLLEEIDKVKVVYEKIPDNVK